VNQREAIKRLLERSSLGTPGARSLRARTDPAAVRRIMERARKDKARASTAALTITCDPSDGHDRRDCLVEFLLDRIEAEKQRGPEGDASITPLTITCDASRPDSPHGHDCHDCLVDFFLGNTKADVTRLSLEADQPTEPSIMDPDLRAAFDALSAAGLEPEVRSNHRSAPPDRESKAG
jgi:hypothetical protein